MHLAQFWTRGNIVHAQWLLFLPNTLLQRIPCLKTEVGPTLCQNLLYCLYRDEDISSSPPKQKPKTHTQQPNHHWSFTTPIRWLHQLLTYPQSTVHAESWQKPQQLQWLDTWHRRCPEASSCPHKCAAHPHACCILLSHHHGFPGPSSDDSLCNDTQRTKVSIHKLCNPLAKWKAPHGSQRLGRVSLTLPMHVPHFSLVLPSLVLQQQRPPLPAFMNMKSHKNVSSCIYYHAHFTHLLLRSRSLLQEQNDKCTHDPESNMLDSMKHWVAMGGAAVAAAGMGGSWPLGCTMLGKGGWAVPAWDRALAAYWGIWKPVPACIKQMTMTWTTNVLRTNFSLLLSVCVCVCVLVSTIQLKVKVQGF